MGKIMNKGQVLKKGYTTGTCALSACKACLIYFFEKIKKESVEVKLPKGDILNIPVKSVIDYGDYIESTVVKESGDDPDVTNGIEIVVQIYAGQDELIIDGGYGVGRVTKEGLKIPVGQAAINQVPRDMIKNQVETICTEYKYNKSFKVIINAKNGEEIAKKTFNERLGIIGGISILGTTGIVEPMSEKALVESIKKEIDVYLAGNDYILITPGNYGKEAAYNHFGIDLEKGVKISNFIGEILDYLLYKNPKGILLIGHAGKLSKVAGGIMNTHSSYADCRHEIFASYAALYGARQKVIEEIFNAATTDEMDYILIKNNLHEKVWQKIMDNVVENINRRLDNKIKCEVIIFTNKMQTIKQSCKELEFIKYFKD